MTHEHLETTTMRKMITEPGPSAAYRDPSSADRGVSRPSGRALAWVCDESQLDRALADLSALFQFRIDRGTLCSEPPLIGVWVGSGDPANDPALRGPGSDLASTRLAGVWSVLWLEDEVRLSGDPVEGLAVTGEAESMRRERHRFLPIVSSRLEDELDALPFSDPSESHLALIQDPVTGRIARWAD